MVLSYLFLLKLLSAGTIDLTNETEQIRTGIGFRFMKKISEYKAKTYFSGITKIQTRTLKKNKNQFSQYILVTSFAKAHYSAQFFGSFSFELF